MNKNNPTPADSNQISNKTAHFPAKLAIIAGAFSVLGDLLGTVAAALDLEEIRQAEYLDQQSSNEQEERLQNMQKQIDDLTIQLHNLTKK